MSTKYQIVQSSDPSDYYTKVIESDGGYVAEFHGPDHAANARMFLAMCAMAESQATWNAFERLLDEQHVADSVGVRARQAIEAREEPT